MLAEMNGPGKTHEERRSTVKKGIKVLLVDDEREFVESLSERLQLRNVLASVAHDGEEALSALEGEEADVMILDLRMPGIDGVEVLKRVKQSHPGVEVVILTGHGNEADEQEVFRLGASAYLKKPVDVDQLLRAVHKERLKVLLVDDEKDFVENLSKRLQLRNLETQVALDGEAALEVVQQGNPDVMVLDLRMPGIDGIQVLRQVRQTHPQMAVVVLTGHGNDLDEAEARRLGASAYLHKPVELDQLVSTLHSVWQRLKKSKTIVDAMLMAVALTESGESDIARDTLDELDQKISQRSSRRTV
jgi:DNA-binding response OmpR family regulator